MLLTIWLLPNIAAYAKVLKELLLFAQFFVGPVLYFKKLMKGNRMIPSDYEKLQRMSADFVACLSSSANIYLECL